MTGVSDRTAYLPTKAIFHLHGQGHGIAMLNSSEDTKAHATRLRSFFRHTLENAPMIIAGYSGRSDAAFDELKALYVGQHCLHWAGYDAECQPHIRKMLADHEGPTDYYPEADADIFFMDLGRALGCWPDTLFNNPAQHLLEEIEPIIDYPVKAIEGETEDLLENLRERLRSQAKDKQNSETDLETLMMKNDWDAIIDRIDPKTDKPEEKRWLAIAYQSKADSLGDRISSGLSDQEIQEMWGAYQSALDIKPDSHTVLYNWGCSLADLAQATDESDLFRQAGEKYAQALEIKPDDHEALNNWGFSLADLARMTDEPDLFRQAIEKFAQALKIKPDKHDALYNWASCLLSLFNTTGNTQYLEDAEAKLLAARDLNPDKLYNLACLYALTNRVELSLHALEHCETAGTLPPLDHLKSDSDLDALRDHPRFVALLERLEAAEK